MKKFKEACWGMYFENTRKIINLNLAIVLVVFHSSSLSKLKLVKLSTKQW